MYANQCTFSVAYFYVLRSLFEIETKIHNYYPLKQYLYHQAPLCLLT